MAIDDGGHFTFLPQAARGPGTFAFSFLSIQNNRVGHDKDSSLSGINKTEHQRRCSMVRSNLRKGYYFNSPHRMQEGDEKIRQKLDPGANNSQKRLRLQAGAANQGTIHVSLAE